MTPMRFLVSWITLSTLEKVAALPTVGFLTLNCSCCTYVGTWSRCSRSSFLWDPMGTCQHRQQVSNWHSHYLAWPRSFWNMRVCFICRLASHLLLNKTIILCITTSNPPFISYSKLKHCKLNIYLLFFYHFTIYESHFGTAVIHNIYTTVEK